MSVSVTTHEHERSPTRCPYCHDDLREGQKTWTCPSCATSYHAECVRENGKCAVMGCRGYVAPPLVFGKEREPTPSESPWWRLGAFLAMPPLFVFVVEMANLSALSHAPWVRRAADLGLVVGWIGLVFVPALAVLGKRVVVGLFEWMGRAR